MKTIILTAVFITFSLIVAWMFDKLFDNHIQRTENIYMGIGLLTERFNREIITFRKEIFKFALVLGLMFILYLLCIVLLS